MNPSRRPTVFRDEPDNRILECAVERKAEVIVPGDKTMMGIGEYGGIRPITLAEFLDRRGRKAT